MLDKEYRDKLKDLPNPEIVIKELFERSIGISIERSFVLLMGVERVTHNEKTYLQCISKLKWIIGQFVDYYNQVLNLDVNDFDDNVDKSIIIRQQMQVYSSFWECTWFKQLFWSLLQNIHIQKYDPEIFTKINKRSTGNLFEEIIKISNEHKLYLSKYLALLYNNQIRNALFHSDLYICADSRYILFENYNHNSKNDLPSLHFDTWKVIFSSFKNFVYFTMYEKNNLDKQLIENSPLVVRLPEFPGEVELGKDRGMYYAKPLY